MALMATLLITAGCGGSNTAEKPSTPSTVSPSDMSNQQQPPARLVIDVAISGGNVTPTNAQLRAKVKEPIVIRVKSDAADQLHVHSVPEHTFNIDPKPGQSFQFTVDVPGQVEVELHQLNRTIATIQLQP
jgi:heme/copper-type cytochrome/quinol oxidase subunit 2